MNRWFWTLAFMGLATLGCGPSGPATYPIKGTVTWDGEPLSEGDIVFLDVADKLPPAAGKIQNGQFQVQSVPGKKRVEIRATRMEKLPAGQEGAMGETEAPVDYIPDRYNLETELTAEVQASEANELNFPLESK